MVKRKTKTKKLKGINTEKVSPFSPLIKNINKNKNIINIKINPIQQTNRRRRRKQLNKSLNKNPVNKVQGYYQTPNLNMRPSSFYSADNAFQRTKDLLLQDERTKHLIENKSKMNSFRDYPQLEYQVGKSFQSSDKPLKSKDPLQTKINLLEDEKNETKTKPLIEEVKTTLKNKPEYEDYKTNDPNVYIEDDKEEEYDDIDMILNDLRRNFYSKTEVRQIIEHLTIVDLKQLYFKYTNKEAKMNKKKLKQEIIDYFGKDLRLI